jgi:hypothetical protein
MLKVRVRVEGSVRVRDWVRVRVRVVYGHYQSALCMYVSLCCIRTQLAYADAYVVDRCNNACIVSCIILCYYTASPC